MVVGSQNFSAHLARICSQRCYDDFRISPASAQRITEVLGGNLHVLVDAAALFGSKDLALFLLQGAHSKTYVDEALLELQCGHVSILNALPVQCR